MKKIKSILIQALAVNVLGFLALTLVGRGVKKFISDIVVVLKAICTYFFTKWYLSKVLVLIAVLAIVGYSVFAFISLFKKKKDVFGLLFIFISIFFLCLGVAHIEVVQNMFTKTSWICNKTCAVCIVIEAVLSICYLAAIGGVKFAEQLSINNKNRKEKQAEQVRIAIKQKKYQERQKAIKESKEKKESVADDFEVVENTNKDKVDSTPVQETKVEPSQPVKEEKVEEKVKKETTIDKEEKNETIILNEEKQEKEEVLQTEPKIEENKEALFEEDYSLTEEGYLPVDNKKVADFSKEFASLSEKNKTLYSKIKNQLIRSEKVKSKVTKASENFKVGRQCIARISTYKNGIRVYFAIDPYNVDANTYHQYDADSIFPDTPLMVKVYSDESLEKANQLLLSLYESFALELNPLYKEEDYTTLSKD